MIHAAIKYPLAGIILLASVHAGFSMDLIVCKVDDKSKAAQTDIAGQLCDASAEAANARQITASEMNAMLRSPSTSDDDDAARLHVVEASLPSAREIAFSYAFGTVAEWRDHHEKRFSDLHIDIMDAELNDATIGMFADTIRRLSQ